MINVRFHPDPDPAADATGSQGGDRARFNLLLTEDRPRDGWHWTRQLPRLLAPQGVHAYVARTGREAIDVAERLEIHAAVIDLATPLSDSQPASQSNDPTQMWLLELFHRLPQRPPTVVIHGGFFNQARANRLLSQALRLGAFSVLAKPIDVETLLRVFQRMVDRRYAGTWPVATRIASIDPTTRPDDVEPPASSSH